MKVKRRLKRILFLLILLGAGTKIYFEIDHSFFESKLEEMKESEKVANIESVVEHKTLAIDSFTVHYYISGTQNEETIVFLHPAFSDHSAFDQQIDFFSKDYKVIAIDLIGHGLSKANKSPDKIDNSSEHISKILEAEKIDKVHMVGVSIVALMVQYFALNNPAKVQTLTALGGYNINKESKEVQKAQRGTNMGLLFRALFSMNAFRKKVALISCHSEKGQALFYKGAAHYERKSFTVMQGLQEVIKNKENVQIAYPTLILTGEFDIELAKKMAEEWHAELANSAFYTIENAGHSANMDNPLVFNEKVKAFLDSCVSVRG